MTNVTPLRYPGGKASFYSLFVELIRMNRLQHGVYAEPYAGGAGLALRLLFNGHVSRVLLNDIDRGIWSFWNSVLNDTDLFVDKILSTEVTVDEWENQRQVYRDEFQDTLSLGFATFFLNRCNRSGIVKNAGVIGGRSQEGKYKIGCRFNKTELIARIRRIEMYRDRISLSGDDALAFMRRADSEMGERGLFCIDPPYFNKGSTLYTSFYCEKDHAAVAETVRGLNTNWVVTYDDEPQIVELYSEYEAYSKKVGYSVQRKRLAKEVVILSERMACAGDLERCLARSDFSHPARET